MTKFKSWCGENQEYTAVYNHYYAIFNRKHKAHKNYKGMPFFDNWNPKKGGSIRAGANWIIKNLGSKPKGCTLHVIEHERGFVPGNLVWTYPRNQVSNQMFKVIARLKRRIRQLENQLRVCKAKR